jgi:hypothetical protein
MTAAGKVEFVVLQLCLGVGLLEALLGEAEYLGQERDD